MKEFKKENVVVQTPEEKVRDYYERIPGYEKLTDSVDYLEGQRFAIVHTLDLLGIKIAGVNA